MTTNELKQPMKVFFEAGRKAFKLGVLIVNNPYIKSQKHKTAWEKGYKVERRNFNTKRKEFKHVYIEEISGEKSN